MRTEVTRTFPVTLRKGFAYIDDFTSWPAWYSGMIEILEPGRGAWRRAGDRVRFAYKLLGRRVEGASVLEAREEGARSVFRTEVPGLPTFHFEYHFAAAGPEAFQLKVVMRTDEPAGLLGKVLDRAVLPRVVEADLRKSLENLEQVFGSKGRRDR